MRKLRDKGEEQRFMPVMVTQNGGEECHLDCPFLVGPCIPQSYCRLFGDLEEEFEDTANKSLPPSEWLTVKRSQKCKKYSVHIRGGMQHNR